MAGEREEMSESMKECVEQGSYEITGVLQHGVIKF